MIRWRRISDFEVRSRCRGGYGHCSIQIRYMTTFLVSSAVALALAVPVTAFSSHHAGASDGTISAYVLPDLVDDVRRLPSNTA